MLLLLRIVTVVVVAIITAIVLIGSIRIVAITVIPDVRIWSLLLLLWITRCLLRLLWTSGAGLLRLLIRLLLLLLLGCLLLLLLAEEYSLLGRNGYPRFEVTAQV